MGSLVLMFALAVSVPAAFAQLERVGPVNPAHGFPAWYQDNTGLALEFCVPTTQAELDGGWCLLLPADTTVPESFPTAFADEHFYWAANAGINYTAGGVSGRALLVLGLEAAFSQGPVVAGDQVVFGRIRVSINNLPYDGTYTILHPYGTWTVEGVAGGRIFATEDIGFNCPAGRFDCALGSNVWPFLLPANPNPLALNPELPPVVGPGGKLHIADPALLYPVTGSRTTPAQNFFRVVGPNGFTIETNQFSLMGRIYTGQIPGKVNVGRASYARTALDAVQLDVFATGLPTTAGRLPGQTRPASVSPVLGFYPAPCAADAAGLPTEPVGIPVVQMYNDATAYWAQAALTAIPAAVCVEDYTARDAAGQLAPAFYGAAVTDVVSITQADFDPAGGMLTVQASSSDAFQAPELTVLPYDGLMTSGLFNRAGTIAPAPAVRVRSTWGGIAEREIAVKKGALSGVPVAVTDGYTVLEDSGPTALDVLTNDIYTAPALVTITGPPSLGSAVVNGDGTISYTPNANAFGADGIAYTVTASGLTSPAAYVTINITNVNDAPVAVDDTANGVAGQVVSIPVLGNDTDADGAADLAAAVNITVLTAGASATWDPVGGTIVFVAPAAGTYSFTYQAQDRALAASANAATVTVTIGQLELLTVARVEYIASKLRWRIAGTSNIIAGQVVTFTYENGVAANGASLQGYVLGSMQVDPTGLYDADFAVNGTSLANVANPLLFRVRPTFIRATSPLGGTNTGLIAIK